MSSVGRFLPPLDCSASCRLVPLASQDRDALAAADRDGRMSSFGVRTNAQSAWHLLDESYTRDGKLFGDARASCAFAPSPQPPSSGGEQCRQVDGLRDGSYPIIATPCLIPSLSPTTYGRAFGTSALYLKDVTVAVRPHEVDGRSWRHPPLPAPYPRGKAGAIGDGESRCASSRDTSEANLTTTRLRQPARLSGSASSRPSRDGDEEACCSAASNFNVDAHGTPIDDPVGMSWVESHGKAASPLPIPPSVSRLFPPLPWFLADES